MTVLKKSLIKAGSTIGMFAIVASAMALYASASDTSFTLSDRSVSSTSYTYYGYHNYEQTNMNGIQLNPVCMYNGLKKAKARIYDDNQGIYLMWNGSDDTVSAVLTEDEYDWVCDTDGIGDHTFKFYVKGYWSSGNFSGRAVVV